MRTLCLATDIEFAQVDARGTVELRMRPAEDTIEQTLTDPPAVMLGDHLLPPVPRGQVSRWDGGAEDPRSSVKHGEVVGSPAAATVGREWIPDALPSPVGKLRVSTSSSRPVRPALSAMPAILTSLPQISATE